MAVVPSAFGIWNIVYMRLKPRRSLPIGLHGALLPVILITVGTISALASGLMVTDSHGVTWFGAVSAPYSLLVPWFFGLMALYYLIWKYVVGFLNQVLGIA